MRQKYDLTNKSELKEIITTYVFSDPVLALGKYVFDKIFSTDTFALQKETAEKLIQRVKRMEFLKWKLQLTTNAASNLMFPLRVFRLTRGWERMRKCMLK